MNVVTIGEVIEVNRALGEQGVAAKVHLHDACGRQTLSIEVLDGIGDGRGDTLGVAREAIRRFFSDRGMPIEFDPVEEVNFWAV